VAYEERADGALRKPKCFGDPEEHSPRDRTCQDCRFFQTCAVIVKNKRRDDERGDDRRRDDRRDDRREPRRDDRRGLRAPDPEDYIERDDAAVGFFGALMFNGAMSAVRAGLVEAVFATDQIPRFQYPDPFIDAFVKKKPEGDK